ncbi:MAG: ArsR family transcriptional regulator [Thermoplasmata archaeon]|nr:ArsR family transcriptional regulator [Thermoplasmata archaeon]
MNRIKVINEPAELISVFRAVDTELKREIFKEISVEWRTVNYIEEKFGKDGKKALRIFEKMNLVETRWQQPGEDSTEKPVKAYHTYYSSFHINTSASVFEISDIIAAAGMPDKEFKKIEEIITSMVVEDGVFAGDVSEELNVSATMLKALVKRSAELEYRGHRIEKYEE